MLPESGILALPITEKSTYHISLSFQPLSTGTADGLKADRLPLTDGARLQQQQPQLQQATAQDSGILTHPDGKDFCFLRADLLRFVGLLSPLTCGASSRDRYHTTLWSEMEVSPNPLSMSDMAHKLLFSSVLGTVTGIPACLLNDQFGMAGLLTFIRAVSTEPAIVSLALGQDLTRLGVNLNSPQ